MAGPPRRITHWTLDALGLEAAKPVRVLRGVREGDRNPRHDHDFWEVSLIVGGEAVHETDGGAGPMTAGHAIVIRPGVFHVFRECRSLEVMICAIVPSVFERELAWLYKDAVVGPLLRVNGGRVHAGEPIVVRLDEGAMGRARSALEPVAGRGNAPVGFGRAEGVGRAAALLGVVGEAWSVQGGERAAMPRVVRKAAEALEWAPARAWKRDDLSREVDCSVAYLTRQFTEAMGMPPMAYLARVRAERAAVILRRTDEPIAEVGALVGYGSPEHFSRRFREQYRLSPSQYRKRHRGG